VTISITLDRPGGRPLDLVGAGWNAVRYSTVVSGGFGALVLVAPGDVRKQIPDLAVIRVLNDDRLVWEGMTEDREFAWDPQSQTTTITLFGKQRLLQLASVRRMWSLRSLQIQPTLASNFNQANSLQVTIGFLDLAQPTVRGIRIAGTGVSATDPSGAGASIIVPAGAAAIALLGTFTTTNTSHLFGQWITYDATATQLFGASLNTSQDFSLDFSATPAGNVASIQLTGQVKGGSAVLIATDYAQWSNLRLLGTRITEDTPGGYYAATLLRDVLSLVPGITAGQIDQGLEYVIQELDRSTRTNVQSVVNEIASYFTREWAVWDDGRFDWLQPNLSEPGWVIPLADTISGRIKQTVDGLARDTYLTYVDPSDQRTKEASYQTTRLGNPFLRNGLLSDDLEAPGLAFTPLTAAAFAQAANLRNSRIPAAQGTVVVPAWKQLARSTGGRVPALEIRAGDNITIPDFPTDDAFSAGQDNQTLFHVVQVDVDLAAATVTLTIAGYLPGLDVLTARLNASTKVVSS
jgi:hypothetical protein